MDDKLDPAAHPLPRIPGRPTRLLAVPADTLVARLHAALEAYVSRRGLGRSWTGLDVVLDRREGIVLRPHIAFVADGRESIVSNRIWGPPDMVIEVISGVTHPFGLDERVAWYSLYGVRECWLVRLSQGEVSVLELAPGGVRRRTVVDDVAPMASPLLPDFNRCLGEFL